jgi:hypothetical protein
LAFLQEANGFDRFLRWRLRRTVAEAGMAKGFLAHANATTTGHRFHSAILVGSRVRVLAHGADRTRDHHVLGWAELELPGLPAKLDVRNYHLDPFDPRHRAIEAAPAEVLADPKRCSLLIGDFNTIGLDFPEPDWTAMAPHLLNEHLGLPATEDAEIADRSALELLERAGFVDVATLAGLGHLPIGGFDTHLTDRAGTSFEIHPTRAPGCGANEVGNGSAPPTARRTPRAAQPRPAHLKRGDATPDSPQ